MGIFDRWRLNRAAKAYALQLGPALARTFGASQHYTAPQIETATRKLGLNLKYLCLAYAAFLPEAEYEQVLLPLSFKMPYSEATAIFARYRPHGLTSASGTPGDVVSPGG